MLPFRVEATHDPNGAVGGFAFLTSGVLVLGGILGAFHWASLSPLAASVLGICIYAWLLKSELKRQYEFFVVLTIDESGIRYRLAPAPSSPSVLLRWPEVVIVTPRLASQGADPPGLEVLSTRYGRSGVPLLVPVGSDAQIASAVSAALFFKSAHAENVA